MGGVLGGRAQDNLRVHRREQPLRRLAADASVHVAQEGAGGGRRRRGGAQAREVGAHAAAGGGGAKAAHRGGGGEGRASGGRPRSKNGIPAKGFRTRSKTKSSNKFIIERRKK